MAATQNAAHIPFNHDSNYLTLSRILPRLAFLILLTSTGRESIDLQLAPLQKKTQAELYSPLPFHRTRWLRSVENARTLLLKLELSVKEIKVQRTKREAMRDLAEKRNMIKMLRKRIEEIGRAVELSGNTTSPPEFAEADDGESMYDVLEQIRNKRRKISTSYNSAEVAPESLQETAPSAQLESETSEQSDSERLFSSGSKMRKRQGAKNEPLVSDAKTSGFSHLAETEKTLMNSSKEHEDLTTSLVSMAAQLKQQARQFQFTLEQDKGLLDRAIDGLDQNVSAMGIASKGMKTLQRMSEEQGWLGRLKLYAYIMGLWLIAILLVFAGPKLRF